ncbi:TPA: hypothetical protein ACU16Q_002166 [Pasteurella multocida]|uniref:hypothetical protein n=1 Tax=Pasteurella multocida TaxID=747 RepID=UPI001898A19C|nr:hypothetical protein [Pasteurella multocida]MBF6983771.1 hypothetical protein [Pasteurella multocida]
MNTEEFITKQLRNFLSQGGVDVITANEIISTCIQEYRQRSSFKPDVMTYLLDKAKRLARKKKKGK